jgi:tetratricopeptide (TPR) repeat protein
MLVTCTFYGLRHGQAKVAFQVEREHLTVGEVFAFAGESYVILSVVAAAHGTYAVNVAPEQDARARMPNPGLRRGDAHGHRPPPEASTGQAPVEASEAELQRLRQEREGALTRLGQLVQQLDHLQRGEGGGEPSDTNGTSIAAADAGETARFPDMLQTLEARLPRLAARLARLASENRQLEAHAQAARARVAALEAEVHELRRPRDAAPAATEGARPPCTAAQDPSDAYAVARLKHRLSREPADVQTRVELAACYARHGLDEHAIREYRHVLTLRPACVEALEPLALLLEKLNRPHEAAALWERLLGGPPEQDPAPRGGPHQTALDSTSPAAVTASTRHPRPSWRAMLVARLLSAPLRAAP